MAKRFLKAIALMAALCGILALAGTGKTKAATAISADTSWYEGHESDTEYTLTTAEQLFGLAELAQANNFEGKTINLTENGTYVLNDDYLTEFSKWKAGTATATNVFPGIGTIYNGTAPFKGIFNGNGATIYGMYRSVTSRSGGFFNSIVGAGTVNDLNFDYCYTKSTAQGAAIIVGTICSASNYAWNGNADTNHFSLNNVTTGTNCYVTTSANYTGLICGEIWGAGIKNATANGAVKASNATGGNARGAAGISGGSTSNLIWFCNCTNNATVDSDNWGVAGIFGCWQYATNGTVRFTDCLNTGAITDTTNNSYSVGGIMGGTENAKGFNIQITDCENRGTIKCTRAAECYAGGIIGRFAPASGGTLTVTNCKNTGNVSGYSYVGGIVGRGQSNININGAYVSGTIAQTATGAAPFTGGVLGHNTGNTTIKNAYVVATVTTARTSDAACMGGIVGTFAGVTLTLEQCGFFGTLTNVSTSYGQVGLIIGQANGNGATGTLNFTKCFAASDALAGMKGAGAVGQNVGGYNTNGWPVVLQKADMKGEGLYPYIQLDSNWKYVANDIPQLVKFSDSPAITPTYDGVKADYSWFTKVSGHTQKTSWTIVDAADYLGLVGISAAWPSNENVKWGSCTILLDDDIVLNTGDASTWGTTAPANKYLPIGVDVYNASNAIQLSIDGQNHTISGLYVKTAGMAGMISQMNVGTIQNLTLTNSYIEGNQMRTGAIAACVSGSGTFKNLKATDTVYVKGKNYVGGILGQAWGCTVQNCESNANIVGDNDGVGGIVGGNTDAVMTVTGCKFGGKVTGNAQSVGGIVGSFPQGKGGTISDCIVSGTVLAKTNMAGGIVGYQKGEALTISGCLITEDAVIRANRQVVGGVIGQNDIAATIQNTEVKGTLLGGFQVAGFVGQAKANLTIENSEFSGEAENLPQSEFDFWRIDYSYQDNDQKKTGTYKQWVTGSDLENQIALCDEAYGSLEDYKVNAYHDYQRFSGIIGDITGTTTITLTDLRVSGSIAVESDENSGNINMGGVIGLLQANVTLNATRILVDGTIQGNQNAVGIFVGQNQVAIAKLNLNTVYCAKDSATKTKGGKTTQPNAFDTGTALTEANAKVTYFTKNEVLGGDGYKTFKALGFLTSGSKWFLAEGTTPLLKDYKGEATPAEFLVTVTAASFNKAGENRQSVGTTTTGGTRTSNFAEALNITTGDVDHYNFLGWYALENETVDFSKAPISENKDAAFTLQQILDYAVYAGSETDLVAVYLVDGNYSAEITVDVDFPFTYQINEDAPVNCATKVTFFAPVGATVTVTFGGDEGTVDFYGWYNASNHLLTRNIALNFVAGNTEKIQAEASEKSVDPTTYVVIMSNSSQVMAAGVYAADDTILFPENPFAFGMNFIGWNVAGTVYADNSEAEAAIQAIIAGGRNTLYVRAAFEYKEDTYQINVQPVLAESLDDVLTNTNLGDLIPGASYKVGELATITADAEKDDHLFRFFMDANGEVLSYENSFIYRGTATKTIYAVYADEDATVAPIMRITDLITFEQGDGRYTYTAIVNRSVSEGYTIKDQGILAFVLNGTDPAEGIAKANTYLTLDKVGMATPDGTILFCYKSENLAGNSATTLNLKNVTDDRIVYVKGYMTYTNDSTGETVTEYTTLGYVFGNTAVIQ